MANRKSSFMDSIIDSRQSRGGQALFRRGVEDSSARNFWAMGNSSSARSSQARSMGKSNTIYSAFGKNDIWRKK